jgi:hypothetical protein
MALKRLFQELANFQALGLGKYRANSGLMRGLIQEGRLVYREDQNRDVWRPSSQFPGCAQPVEYRHAHIEDDNIGVYPPRFPYCFGAIAGLKYSPTRVPLEKCPHLLAPKRAVVGNQNACGHRLT